MMSKIEGKTTLFTLRVWADPQNGNRVEWRGKLQALPDGEAYFFRGWSELINYLEAMLGSRRYADDDSSTEK